MRWFWLFIALLALLTGVLFTRRVRQERAELAAMQAQAEASAPSTTTRRSRTRDRTPAPGTQPESAPDSRTVQPEPEPDTQEPETHSEPESESEPDADTKTEPEPAASTPTEPVAEAQTKPDEQPGDEFSPDELLEMFRASAPDEEPQDDPDPESAPIEQALAQAADQQNDQSSELQPEENKAPAPEAPQSYELRADGSFKVLDANAWVQGAGTNEEPYVLSWGVLKSIEKLYEPREGKEKLPDWLDLLDGKTVLIEGNTLVPVVATTTRELLVMQNPWDGCCIGVPPTPYDAIEVVLNHDVDFGNSAVGYGTVQGTFYLDPYVVDGWVLGIYIIEDAKYRSGEGVAFPEF
ncbi:MAG: hypothetical protein ACF8MF_14020 [Phycisphaerales bacterium JB052]